MQIEIFPKGLVLGFRQKLTISPSLFTGNDVDLDVLAEKGSLI